MYHIKRIFKRIFLWLLAISAITVGIFWINGGRLDLLLLNHNIPFTKHQAFVQVVHQSSLNFQNQFGADLEFIFTNLENGRKFEYFSNQSQIHTKRSIASIGKLFIARAAINSQSENDIALLNKMLCTSDPVSAQKLYDSHHFYINELLAEYEINQASSSKQTVTSEINAMSLPDLNLFLNSFAQELMEQRQVLPKNALQKGCTAQNIKFNSKNKIILAKTGSASFKGVLTSKLLVVAFYNHRQQPYLLTMRVYNDSGLCRKGVECFNNVEFKKLVSISDNFANF